MKEERKKEENRGNLSFRPIMEWLIGKGLERSEGTSSIAKPVSYEAVGSNRAKI